VSGIDYFDIGIHNNIENATSYSLTGSCHSALAGREIFPGEDFRLAEISLIQPLILFDAARVAQIVVRDTGAGVERWPGRRGRMASRPSGSRGGAHRTFPRH
jgi:hypothetical protein